MDSADPRRCQYPRLFARLRLRATCRRARVARRSAEWPHTRGASLVEPACLPSTRHQSPRIRSARTRRLRMATDRRVARLRIRLDPGALRAISGDPGRACHAGRADRKPHSRHTTRGARHRSRMQRRFDGRGLRSIPRAPLGESDRSIAIGPSLFHQGRPGRINPNPPEERQKG